MILLNADAFFMYAILKLIAPDTPSCNTRNLLSREFYTKILATEIKESTIFALSRRPYLWAEILFVYNCH